MSPEKITKEASQGIMSFDTSLVLILTYVITTKNKMPLDELFAAHMKVNHGIKHCRVCSVQAKNDISVLM